MARTVRVTRISNPRRRHSRGRRRVSARRRAVSNPSHRTRSRPARRTRSAKKRLTAKQIKYFGTPAQKAALRRRKSGGSKRRTASRRNPPAVRRRRRVTARRRVRRNPVPVVVTLGAVNPRRRKSRMARRRTRRARRANPVARRRYSRRRRNTTVYVRTRRRRYGRRSNPVGRRRYSRRRRNPSAFGMSGSRNMVTMAGGVVAGVFASKFLPTLVPAGLLPASGGWIMRAVITGASAFVAQFVAKQAKLGTAFADGVLLGGLAQTVSVAANGLLPGFAIGGVPVGLNGMSELMPGQFSVPQNPLRLPPPPPAQARIGVSGLQRAFGSAY